eukprot:TRINITY_DN76829_c0_g1_i1.p1 TRINITY_DN76829_c0_g1~~TRINITY_DN76829_c0_g1_i1.p1  ORF type:complete len:265 (-),score=21.28 TRINITY_DN76829_c0_g1_i1:157-951(-)
MSCRMPEALPWRTVFLAAAIFGFRANSAACRLPAVFALPQLHTPAVHASNRATVLHAALLPTSAQPQGFHGSACNAVCGNSGPIYASLACWLACFGRRRVRLTKQKKMSSGRGVSGGCRGCMSTARFAGSDSGTNSRDFQQLMGVLYGVAGLLHLLDLLGPNALPKMAGAPPFQELSVLGQAAALGWCATGPFAFAITRLASKPFGDASLAFYGLYEIGLAASVSAAYPAAGVDGVLSAVQVQLVVLAAYVYTAWKDESDSSIK